MKRAIDKAVALLEKNGQQLNWLAERLGHKGQSKLSKWQSRKKDILPSEVLEIARMFAAPGKVQLMLEFLCDPRMEEPPEPQISPAEEDVLKVVRVMGPEAALKKLVSPGMPEMRASKPIQGTRDRSASTRRRTDGQKKPR